MKTAGKDGSPAGRLHAMDDAFRGIYDFWNTRASTPETAIARLRSDRPLGGVGMGRFTTIPYVFLVLAFSIFASRDAASQSPLHPPGVDEKPIPGVFAEFDLKPKESCHHLAASPVGALISMSLGGSVTLWDAQTGKSILLGPFLGTTKAVFSPDGTTLALLRTLLRPEEGEKGGPSIQLWRREAGNWRIVKRIDVPGGGMQLSLCYSPDGKWLAASFDKPGVVAWDAASGEVAWRADGFYAFFSGFSRDSRYFAAGSGRNPSVWEWPSGNQIWKSANLSPTIYNPAFVGRDDLIWPLQFTPDIARYHLSQRQPGAPLRIRSGGGPILVSPDGGLLLVESGVYLEVRELWTRTTLCSVTAPNGFLSHACTTCGRYLVTSEKGKTLVWDVPALVRGSLPKEERERVLSDDELWEALGSPQRGAGFLAFWALADRGKERLVPWLRKRMEGENCTAVEFVRAAEELESDDVAVREAARTLLRNAAWRMPKELAAAAAAAESVEAAAVLKGLQAELVPDELAYIASPRVRRAVRVAHLLETAGTPEAVALIRELGRCDLPDVQDAVRNILWRLPPEAAAPADAAAPKQP